MTQDHGGLKSLKLSKKPINTPLEVKVPSSVLPYLLTVQR